MKNTALSIVFLLALIVGASAQKKSFRIFYSQGKAFVNTGSQKKAAQKDMLIADGQILILDKSSTVIVIAPDKTALPLSVAGKYPYSKLILLLAENNRSLTNRYFTYVVHEMAEAHEKPEEKLTGGVYRGKALMHQPADSCLVIQNTIRFSWAKGTSSDLLFLGIWDENGRNILSKPLRDTTFTYEIKPNATDQDFEWTAGYEQGRSSGIVARKFTIASLSSTEAINTELAELKQNLNLQPEFNTLILCNFYERNRLFIEEYQAIAEANALYPENTLIREYFRWFLGRHGH